MTDSRPRSNSRLVDFFVQTRYVRIVGRQIFPVYSVTIPGGSTLYLRSRLGFDAATVSEVVYKRIYERFFSLKSGDTVIDAGAHIGSFTVMAAGEVGPSGRVVSLEPSNQNFEMLDRNVRSNHLTNVNILKLAAGSAEGTGELKLYNRLGGNSFYVRKVPQTGSEHVKITTLDSVFQQLKLARVDFVKIDVEGYELEVLTGASKILGDYHPKIVLETHDFGPSVEDLTKYLNTFGYSVRTVGYGTHQGLMYAS